MTRRVLLAFAALAACAFACAYLYATTPSAEGQQPDRPDLPTVPAQCPEGTALTNQSVSGGLECRCPDRATFVTVTADGVVSGSCPALIPPTSIVNGCPEAPCPPGYPGDPTEPVPFDDGDPAYPLTPSESGGPVQGRPGSAG